MENIKCEERSFGKKTKNQIKKIFKERTKTKTINQNLIIIISVEDERKLGSWVRFDNGNCIINIGK